MDREKLAAELLNLNVEEGESLEFFAPEKNLLLAVLNTAIDDLKKEGYEGQQARRFFLNTEDEYIFSFSSICSFLNLHPKQVLIVAGLDQDPVFMNSYKKRGQYNVH